jgi:hypothetical protein
MIIFNVRALVMCAIAFAIAFGVGHVVGFSKEGPLMCVAGPLAVALDLTYRLKAQNGHLWRPGGGGSLFYLPVWGFGILWTVLGVVYTVTGASKGA